MPLFYLLLLFFLVVFLVTFIQVGVLTIAFEKLGLSPEGALLLLLGSLFGSAINIPVANVRSTPTPVPPREPPLWGRMWQPSVPVNPGRILIAVNLGGCVIPVGLSLYLLVRQLVNPFDLLLALVVVASVSYHFSRPIHGVGIGMPVFLAPLVAVLTALLLEPGNAAPLAYAGGVLGVLLGADLLRLNQIRNMGAPFASVGGAGTFDGIFLTGIIAALLA